MADSFDTAEEAEAAFYAALEIGDADAVAELWMNAPEVVCVHPGGPQLLGHDQVVKSWRDILARSGGFRIAARLVHQHGDNQVSVHFVNENLFTRDEQAESVTVLATNAYRNTESGWRMILHHASPAPRPAGDATVATADSEETSVTLH